jgi:hypothetical protein
MALGNSMGCATPFKQSWIERFYCLETVGAGIALCGGTQTLLAGLVLSAEGVAARYLSSYGDRVVLQGQGHEVKLQD